MDDPIDKNQTAAKHMLEFQKFAICQKYWFDFEMNNLILVVSWQKGQ